MKVLESLSWAFLKYIRTVYLYSPQSKIASRPVIFFLRFFFFLWIIIFFLMSLRFVLFFFCFVSHFASFLSRFLM